MKMLLLLNLLFAIPAQAQGLLFWHSACQANAVRDYRKCVREVKATFAELYAKSQSEEERFALYSQQRKAFSACRGDRNDDFRRCRDDARAARATEEAQLEQRHEIKLHVPGLDP